MDVGKAIRAFRQRRGMFQAELARRIGIRRERLSRIESGRSQPPPDVFSRIADQLGVTMEDIIGLAQRQPDTDAQEPAGTILGAGYEGPSADDRGLGRAGQDADVEDLGGIRVRALVPVPVYGEVPAGPPDLAADGITEVRHIDPDMVRWIPGDAAKNSFWLRVRGDSMHEQTDDGGSLTDGDLILVCRDVPCSDGEIGVVLLPDGGAAVKRIYRRGGRLLLVSSNPAYPPIEVHDASFVGAVMARWTPPEKFRRHIRRPPHRPV